MSTTVAAMKARLGDTDYYVLAMKAQDLVNRVKIPKELDGWDDLSVEERYQRDISYHRVRTQIAPYLANDDTRFFGAVILAVDHFDENVEFEPLSDVLAKGLPARYRTEAENMGFLNFRGGELLVPLDGQHRLKAIEFALTGRDEKSRDIPDIVSPCSQLAQEDVTVILVPYEPKKARRIFTRVNRYAKPTTTGQNIVTNDDDVVAVLTREVANDLIGGRLAKYTSNTLTTKDGEFTTLSIIYNCNNAIIVNCFPAGKLDRTQLPDKQKQELFRKKVKEVWETVLDGIEVFADGIHDREASGDERRREIRGTNLLGKPVAQECLVRAFVRLTGAPTNMGATDACERLNRLPWNISEENVRRVWQRVLWNGGVDGGRVITKNRTLATEMIAYLAGEKMDDEQRRTLRENFEKQFPEGERSGLELPSLAE